MSLELDNIITYAQLKAEDALRTRAYPTRASVQLSQSLQMEDIYVLIMRLAAEVRRIENEML